MLNIILNKVKSLHDTYTGHVRIPTPINDIKNSLYPHLYLHALINKIPITDVIRITRHSVEFIDDWLGFSARGSEDPKIKDAVVFRITQLMRDRPAYEELALVGQFISAVY